MATPLMDRRAVIIGANLTHRARAAKLRCHTLVTRVAGTIEAMPLWKLQTVGGERDEFL